MYEARLSVFVCCVTVCGAAVFLQTSLLLLLAAAFLAFLLALRFARAVELLEEIAR